MSGYRSLWVSGRVVDQGNYHTHLKRYFDLFPKERIHVCFFEEMRADLNSFMRKLHEFIGVSDVPVADIKPYNVTPMNPMLRTKTTLLRLASDNEMLKKLSALLPQSSRKILRKMFTTSRIVAPLTSRQRSYLARYYAAEIVALERLLNRDLRFWPSHPDSQAGHGVLATVEAK